MKNEMWKKVEEMICEEIGVQDPHLPIRFLTRYGHNAFGAIQKKTTEYFSGSLGSKVTMYEYDRFSRRIRKTETVFDRSGAELLHRAWKYVYALSWRNTVSRKDVFFSDGNGQQTHCINLYDELERIVSETSTDRQGAYRKEYIYTENQREAAEIHHYCDDQVMSYEKCDYDENGNLSCLNVYDRDGSLLCHNEYLYDAYGNMTDRVSHKADGTATYRTCFENCYDEHGNLIHIKRVDYGSDVPRKQEKASNITHYYYKYTLI